MKTATVPSRGLLPHVLSLLVAPICALSVFVSGSATAESVDSELLLLVDASSGGLKEAEFDSLMEGYATALTSSAVLDSIASGATGQIAVSLSFYGLNDSGDSNGVGWMLIKDAASAQLFADQLGSLSQPKGGNKYSYQDALLQGLTSIGTEVGGSTDNGFQSAVQIIEVAGSKQIQGDASDASVNAIDQGIDMISATVIGKNTGNLEAFYTTNVIGGSVGGVAASVSSSSADSGLASILTNQLGQSVTGAAAVPEPSSSMLLISSMGIFLLFARKRVA